MVIACEFNKRKAYQRTPICIKVTNPYFWNKLTDSHNKEVEIEEEFKLLK